MDIVIDIAVFGLLAIAVLPLLVLCLYLILSRFNWPWADRILSAMVPLLTAQLLVGGLVNLIGGLGIVCLGGWMIGYGDTLVHRLLSALLIPFGLWRAYRGAMVLRIHWKTRLSD